MAALGEGSIGRALALAEGDGPMMAAQVARVVSALPQGLAALEVADAVSRDEAGFSLFMDLLRQSVGQAVRQGARGTPETSHAHLLSVRSLESWGAVWQALTDIQNETERFALDRRQAVLAGLSLMAGT
jgi:DNA polymerase-3 subunit delta'